MSVANNNIFSPDYSHHTPDQICCPVNPTRTHLVSQRHSAQSQPSHPGSSYSILKAQEESDVKLLDSPYLSQEKPGVKTTAFSLPVTRTIWCQITAFSLLVIRTGIKLFDNPCLFSKKKPGVKILDSPYLLQEKSWWKASRLSLLSLGKPAV